MTYTYIMASSSHTYTFIVQVTCTLLLNTHTHTHTYSSSRAGKIDTQEVHPFDDGSQRLYGVAVHHWSVLLALVPGEPIVVDDSVGEKMGQ